MPEYPVFKLSRYFSILSLIAVVAVVAGLSWYYRYHATEALMSHQTRTNVALARAFANSVWSRHAEFVRNASNISRKELAAREEIEAIKNDVSAQMRGLNVVKVKIYNVDGLTVFSTEPKQIGVDKRDNTGFQAAMRGEVASSITFRNEFYAFERVIVDRNLVTTYIPLFRDDKTVEAVFELYSDVTTLVNELALTQRKIVIGSISALGLLYVFLMLVVRHADNVLSAREKEHIANEERVRYQAYHDPLTGLPNRVSFAERMKEALARAKRNDNLLGLLFLDLDRFKLVNDSLGHDAGDQLLQVVAERIRATARESDMVFRMGGDEFTLILENLRHAEDAARLAQRLIDNVAHSVHLGEHETTVTVSIGIAIYPSDAENAEDLTKGADAAMYRAKQSGRNVYAAYTAGLRSNALERLTLESELQHALRNDEFELYYQPKVSIPHGRIIGMEALLRWNHPRLDVLPPDRFLTILEDTGLIVPVGEWVLISACKQNKAWQNADLIHTRISVNLSAAQFRDRSLVATVRGALEDSGLEPRFLELELTEGLLLTNTEQAITMMNELKEIGVYLSIDDFGAGYSSLNYLNRFPVDILKIDRSFIKDVLTNKKDAEITHAIAALAHALKLGLIAEGVESHEQLEFLRSQGCDEAQGFLFSRPVPAEEFGRLLAAGKMGKFTSKFSPRSRGAATVSQ